MAALGPADEVNASISTRRNDWVSVTGPATVTADDEAIAQLWSPAAGAYFDGPTDPRIRVLQTPHGGRRVLERSGYGSTRSPGRDGERRDRRRRQLAGGRARLDRTDDLNAHCTCPRERRLPSGCRRVVTRDMHASDGPEREHDHDDRARRVPPPQPPADSPTRVDRRVEVDDEAMRRADAANGEPDASE